MDLRQLNAVAAVAEHGGFSAAARALHTVQSNVSTHVARLEAELGVTLIDRATGLPTEQGEAVVARARRIHAELEALESDVASLADEVRGAVRVGVIGTTGRWLLAPLLEAMSAQHPGIHVVVIDATTTSLLPQVAAGSLDLAVVNLPVDEAELTVEPLFDEDRILIAPTDHPLAAHERVGLVELADHPLLLEPVGTGFRDLLDEEAARAGVRLQAQAEVDGMRLLASLAITGYGAAVVPASALPFTTSPEWRQILLDGLPHRSVGLVRRRRGLPSAPARATREALLAVVAEHARDQAGIRPAAELG
ncbi:MAG: LysR family transcriptional regulator [Acidimicrobiales bacterium]|nr:LysR family transcriptional regulator [Acidimicrobiales bacterium]